MLVYLMQVTFMLGMYRLMLSLCRSLDQNGGGGGGDFPAVGVYSAISSTDLLV